MKLPYSRTKDFSERIRPLIETFIETVNTKRQRYYINVSLGTATKDDLKNLRKFIREQISTTTNEISFISLKESLMFYLNMHYSIFKGHIKGFIRKVKSVDWADIGMIMLHILVLVTILYLSLSLFKLKSECGL